MKVLTYSAGGGLIAGVFLILLLHVGWATPSTTQVSDPQPVINDVQFVKVPLIEYPDGVIINATK